MESETPESGLEELLRLSRQTSRMGKNVDKQKQQEREHQQKMQGTVQGLREISFSIALQQLKLVATQEMIEEVSALSKKPGTEELRKLVSGLTRDLEKLVDRTSGPNQDMVQIQQSVKTLAILIGLFFSIQ